MLPLHRSDDLFNEIFSKTHQQKISQDLISGRASLDGTDMVSSNMGKRRRRKLCAMETDDEIACDKYKKKKLHRDIERRRRQEMTSLSASLRSLLPVEYIKGKRSMSDHMNEAVNYIKHLRKKVKDLGVKRDKLKKVSDLSGATTATSSNGTRISSGNCLIIRPCLVGIEIMFHSSLFPLSRILGVLLEEGILVVSCVSTKVKDPASFNLSGLEEKILTQAN